MVRKRTLRGFCFPLGAPCCRAIEAPFPRSALDWVASCRSEFPKPLQGLPWHGDSGLIIDVECKIHIW